MLIKTVIECKDTKLTLGWIYLIRNVSNIFLETSDFFKPVNVWWCLCNSHRVKVLLSQFQQFITKTQFKKNTNNWKQS